MVAVSDFGSLVPEDSRISKVLRRLFREEDADKFVTLSLQLQVKTCSSFEIVTTAFGGAIA